MQSMKLLIAIVLMFASALAHAEDMRKYQKDTQQLVKAGKHQEALERHTWFHDHALEHNPSMSGVRLSFALSNWKQLGKVYPPAMEELKNTRDRKAALIEKEKGTWQLFQDVTAINRELGEDGKTVALFRKLDKEQSNLAKRCWDAAKKPVIHAKAYDLAAKYIGDPVQEFSKLKQAHDQGAALFGGKNDGGRFTRFNDDLFVKESISLMNLAMALDDPKSAREIQKKALAVVNDKRLQDALPTNRETTIKTPPASGANR